MRTTPPKAVAWTVRVAVPKAQKLLAANSGSADVQSKNLRQVKFGRADLKSVTQTLPPPQTERTTEPSGEPSALAQPNNGQGAFSVLFCLMQVGGSTVAPPQYKPTPHCSAVIELQVSPSAFPTQTKLVQFMLKQSSFPAQASPAYLL